MNCNCDKCDNKEPKTSQPRLKCNWCFSTEELHNYKGTILCRECSYENMAEKLTYEPEISRCETCGIEGVDGYSYGSFHYCSMDCVLEDCTIIVED